MVMRLAGEDSVVSIFNAYGAPSLPIPIGWKARGSVAGAERCLWFVKLGRTSSSCETLAGRVDDVKSSLRENTCLP